MSYILQHPDFGLGNFINLTPAIRWLSQREGRRIPVYFQTDYVRQCFLDCPFIEILDTQPDAGPLFGSNLVNPENDKPDYQYVFEFVTGQRWSAEWHTYVDTLQEKANRYKYTWGTFTVVINGSGSKNPGYISKKDPGQDLILGFLGDKKTIVFVGSEDDASRNYKLKYISKYLIVGNIRECLACINAAENVIANDTGLAHAAAAMNKPLTVLVKDSPRERIKNPGLHTEYVYL